MVWLTYAGRSMPWVLASPLQASLTPHFGPVLGAPGESSPFDTLQREWREFNRQLIAFEARAPA